MKPSFGLLRYAIGGMVVLSAGGCTIGSGVKVADKWELVGPFKVFAPNGENEELTPLPSPTSPRSEEARQPPNVSSNGWFALRGADVKLGEGAGEPVGPAIDPAEHSLFAPVPGVEDTFWYLDLGFRMGMTRLHGTERKLERRVRDPMKVDVLGVFVSPVTPLDRKSEFALTTAYIGIGRRETEWLTWNFYFGTGVGGDRDHQRWATANLEVNFKYALYYTGMTVDIYPWGLSRRGCYVNFAEHLKAGRPYLVGGIEIGYLRAKGSGHFALAPLTLYADEQKIRDWLFSFLVGFGWEVPINERWAFNLSTHYTFHLYRPEEYNGWNVTYALRYRF
ncbi:MAG: hypothetical protein KAV82_05215 [Phycisphaerae bacterium]|nr:hypothetical protein [Phycisphaerae bacterium]